MANVNYNGQSASGGATSLNQLTDVNITSPSDDQVLTYDNGDWVNKAVPSPTVPEDLNDLDDVTITSPTNDQVLTYDNGYWVNKAIPSPTVPEDLNDLDDVNIVTPTNGQALLYDSASSNWVNGDVAGSVSATTIDLSNIVTPSALVEIVYAGVVLKLGMATLYLRVKALSDFTGESGINIVTGIPYIPISFDHKNMEIIGRNLTQGNVGVMGWFRGDTGYEGDIDIATQTMIGVNHHKDDVISMSISYIYREIS